jgi:hypothetical protein
LVLRRHGQRVGGAKARSPHPCPLRIIAPAQTAGSLSPSAWWRLGAWRSGLARSDAGADRPDDYNPQQANETTVIKPPAVVGDGGGWLVVDDIVDTGRTAQVLRKLMPKAHFAAIYAKPLGRALVDTYVTEVSPGHLDLFPWESGQMESRCSTKGGALADIG